MDNFLIHSASPPRPAGRKQRLVATLARLLKIPVELVPLPDPERDMTTVEQRLNLWHLLDQVIAYRVPGEFVDLGCFDGQTSAFLAAVIAQHDPARRLHLYDSFEHHLGHRGDVREALLGRFRGQQLPEPVLCAGRFEATLPAQLPPVIAFAQIDCGIGGEAAAHSALVEFCLGHVWPRLAPGGICVLQDYADPANQHAAADYYPHIKPTVDRFLAAHGIEATALHSGKYNHGFFRKPLA